ncbi:MAG: copper amine oxidase N-terminal domain-containing protein [Clostridiaceae bacterium]|nr:copper amine oxidase N-terminal domain-containing protein [Clostridiaceae bacterium]
MKKRCFVIILLILLMLSTTFSIATDGLSSVTGVFRNYTILYNDTVLNLEMDPVVIENRTYLPLRFIAEALGLTVEWNEETQSVLINSPNFEEVLPAADPLSGEYFVYGEITSIDLENQSIEIEQHLDHNSREVFDALEIDNNTTFLLQRNTHYMELSFKDIRIGDVVSIIVTKNDIVRGMIIDS